MIIFKKNSYYIIISEIKFPFKDRRGEWGGEGGIEVTKMIELTIALILPENKLFCH